MTKKLFATHTLAFVLGIVAFGLFALILPEEPKQEDPEQEELLVSAGQYGANIYLMNLWRKDYVRVNPTALERLINDYRVQNGKKATVRSDGICNIAQTKADYLRGKFNEWYDEEKGEYNAKDMMLADLMSQYTTDEVLAMCPECEGWVGVNSDVALETKRCLDEGQTQYCDGTENTDLRLIENFPSKVFIKWKADDIYRKKLLMPATNACVASNGGVVVYAIDSLE